jgi:hypothetical protein
MEDNDMSSDEKSCMCAWVGVRFADYQLETFGTTGASEALPPAVMDAINRLGSGKFIVIQKD